jgi:hypothetical protein
MTKKTGHTLRLRLLKDLINMVIVLLPWIIYF